MANPENLKNFKKGQSGNPKGRAKGSRNRSTIAREMLALMSKQINPITDEEQELTHEEIITLAQVHKAMKDKDTNAYKALMDSAYGAPKQEIESTNTNTNIDIQDWVEGTNKGAKDMDNFEPDDEKPEKGSGKMWNPTRNL